MKKESTSKSEVKPETKSRSASETKKTAPSESAPKSRSGHKAR